MMSSEEKKLKRIDILQGLEQQAIRSLQTGNPEQAIAELKDIIDEYNRLNMTDRAQVLEITLNEFILEMSPSTVEPEEPPAVKEDDDVQARIHFLEASSKKAIRRFLQGKTDRAVEEMNDIIEGFRQLNMVDRAKALEDWMLEFLEKKLEEDERNLPLSERLEIDPELEDQLLSYRTQNVIKRFAQGQPRRAVEEFTAIVNDYKRQGKLHIVETLEVWFNLFITKMFLVKPEVQTAPIQPPKPLVPQVPKPQIISKPKEAPVIEPMVKFQDKIDKIKNMLKKFEESL